MATTRILPKPITTPYCIVIKKQNGTIIRIPTSAKTLFDAFLDGVYVVASETHLTSTASWSIAKDEELQ